jgi:RNA polymerase sigma-70 factor (ECF subfamily)
VAWRQYIQRSATGDQSALAALYDESSHLVHTMALRILKNPADAEEVTLDVYMRVWNGAQSYRDERGTVGAWLVTLARNKAIDRLRSRGSRTRLEEPMPDHTELRSSGLDPEQEAQTTRSEQRVVNAMQSLPHEQREVLELAIFSGLTHSELALRLNQPLGTVKTRIRQGMMKLRVSLGEWS